MPALRDTRPLAERVYDRLCEDIIGGALPPGSALVQEQVAAQYEVSRTPVRDALTKLTHEGLATLVPGRGYLVNTLSEDDIRDVYEVRYALEAMAARQAVGRHTPQQLVRLRASVDEYETLSPDAIEELFRLSADFHEKLLEPCPNAYLLSTLSAMWAHPLQRRIMMTYRLGPEHQARVVRDHRSILEALAQGDADRLVELLRTCHDPRGLGDPA